MRDSTSSGRARRLTVAAILVGAAVLMTVSPARAAGPYEVESKLRAPDAAPDQAFGYSVAISGDTIVAGSADESAGGNLSGPVYVFVRDGKSWSRQAELVALDARGGDLFGLSLAVSGDIVVVGARAGRVSGSQTGAAYVFVRDGNLWSQQAKLTASDAADSDGFGSNVSVSGNTIVVGSLFDDDDGSASGAAYVFRLADRRPYRIDFDVIATGGAF